MSNNIMVLIAFVVFFLGYAFVSLIPQKTEIFNYAVSLAALVLGIAGMIALLR